MPAKKVKEEKIDKVSETNVFNQLISTLAGTGQWSPEKVAFINKRVAELSTKFPNMFALYTSTNVRFQESEHAAAAKKAGEKAQSHLTASEQILSDSMYITDEKGNKRMRTAAELKELKINPTTLSKEVRKLGADWTVVQKNEQELEKNAGLNARGDAKLNMQQANLALKVVGQIGSEFDKQEKIKEKEVEEEDKRKKAKAKFIGGAVSEIVGGAGEGFEKGRRIRGY